MRHGSGSSRGRVLPSFLRTLCFSSILRRRVLASGFRFVGSTICYAYLQAVGVVNDHLQSCPRWAALANRTQPAK